MFQTFFAIFVLMKPGMEISFTSAEVIARTGITARQLQWWDERGIVVPARKGHCRLYSIDDLAEVAVICDLRRRGFSLQRVRKVMRLLQKEFKKRLVDTVSSHSEYHLLTDGNRIYLKDSAEQVIDLLKNSRQPMLAVCLSDTVRRIQAEAGPHKPETTDQRESAHVPDKSEAEQKLARRKSVASAEVRARRAAI
jgi:DNA-binding transcriptional MerR regulator